MLYNSLIISRPCFSRNQLIFSEISSKVLDLFAENAYLAVRNLQIIEAMIGKKPAEYQMSIFEVALESFIGVNHELVLLGKRIDRSVVGSDFSEYYCADNDRPGVPIRTMVGMMLLKNIYN